MLAIKILAFSIRLGLLVAICLSRMKPIESQPTTHIQIRQKRSAMMPVMTGRQVSRQVELHSPSSRYESVNLPPTFLIIWICSRSVLPFNLNTASTARFAK